MSRLYELTADYLAVMDMLEDDTVDIETVMNTLEGIEGEIEQKADNYAKIIRMLKGEIDVLKAEEERINSRRKTVENNVKRLEKSLEKSMVAIDKKKFKQACLALISRKILQPLQWLGSQMIYQESFIFLRNQYLIREPSLAI